MATVTYEEVSKRFEGVEALRAFSLHVADGEFVVLVGPSGSGKTTALRVLAGLEALSSGTVRIDDVVVNDLPPRDRDIAMVFQNYALYPHMTVYENLAYGLRRRKMPRSEIESRVKGTSEMLELAALLKRKPRELSGGQRQRVALGRALVREPKVFLMDEPLSNLDAKLRAQTRGEIRRLQQRVGTTTIYVTHDQVEAMTMADRMVVLSGGQIEQIGGPDSVYESPANMFVAGFIGSPAMSFSSFSAMPTAEGVQFVHGSIRIDVNRKVNVPAEVSVGVRPEHTRLWDGAPDLVGPIEGRIEFVESLGREMFAGVVADDDLRFTVYVEGRTHMPLGSIVAFGLKRDRVYLFDPATGAALGRC
jgi:multiple sugar transport system ATP-binding protein